jgi:CRP/FNR family cyclic AMP-dependent transcriptional regulator
LVVTSNVGTALAQKRLKTGGNGMMSSPEMLRRIPLFADLYEKDLQMMYRLASSQRFPRGATIFFEEDPGDALYIVLQGMVRIYRVADDGREKTLTFLEEGEFFGEMALLDGGRRSAIAEALEETRTLVILRADFTRLLLERPDIAMEVITVLSQRLRQTNAQLMESIFCDTRQRVAIALIDLASRHGLPSSGGISIALKLTHQELAHMVGAARETVSRVLASLQEEGLLLTDGRRLVVVDMKGLAQLGGSAAPGE